MMRSVLYNNTLDHYRQYYYHWIVAIVFFLFTLTYILWWLSPADTQRIIGNFFLTAIEIFALIIATVAALLAHGRLKSSYTHILHAQSMSYQKLFTTYWLIGIVMVSVLLFTAMIIWMLYIVRYGQLWFATLRVYCYIRTKVIILYTLLYVLLVHSKKYLATICIWAVYIFLYSIPTLQAIVSQQGSKIWIFIVDLVAFIMPTFVNNAIHTNYIQRLLSNVFSIAISHGIYIIMILYIWILSYTKLRRK